MRPWIAVDMLLKLVCLILLTGCSSLELGTPLTPIPTSTDIRIPSTESPHPTPASLSSKGMVRGTLLDLATKEPMAREVLYLGLWTPGGEGETLGMVSVYPGQSPHAVVDSEGGFLFADVEPGRYALLLWSPGGTVLIRDPRTGYDLLFSVSPGETVDLALLYGPSER